MVLRDERKKYKGISDLFDEWHLDSASKDPGETETCRLLLR